MIAAHFRTDRWRFAFVNCYFPKRSGKDRDNSRVGFGRCRYWITCSSASMYSTSRRARGIEYDREKIAKFRPIEPSLLLAFGAMRRKMVTNYEQKLTYRFFLNDFITY